MRLNVADLDTGIAGNPDQGADLVGNHVFQVIGVHVDAPPAEAPKVVETGMGADGDIVFLRRQDHVAHDPGVAAVKAAGDIDRSDDLHDRGVIADVIGAVALADIGVKVYFHTHARQSYVISGRGGKARTSLPGIPGRAAKVIWY